MASVGALARRIKHAVKRALFRVLPAPALNALVRWKMPRSAQLEATTACNLQCPLCVTHDTPRGRAFLEPEVVRAVLDGCGARLKVVSFHLLGEPLLNPRIGELVESCERAGVRTSFSSNGVLLDRHTDTLLDAGLSHLSVAIDGVDAEDYGRYRQGGDFAAVVANTRAFVARRDERGLDRPLVQAQMVMFTYNEDREAEAATFLEGLGVDRVSFKRPAYTAHDDDPVAQAFLAQVDHDDSSRRWARAPVDPARLYRNQRMCPQLERATVLADGKLVACCLDARGETAFGDLHEQGFARLWRGRAHAEVIAAFQRRELPICAHCTLADPLPEEVPGPLPVAAPTGATAGVGARGVQPPA